MSDTDKDRRLALYASAYADDYGFEAVMVRLRQALLLQLIARTAPRTVLEVGCGSEPLHPLAFAAGGRLQRWVIVEPADAFADAALAAPSDGRVTVVRGFVEDRVEAVAAACGGAPDLVLVAGMLHEVADPAQVLRSVHAVMGPDSLLHASVPNAFSLHRRLARAMGLIAHEKVPSERNRRLGQPHVFALADLVALVERAGFAVVASGGNFLKPFTHAQMESLRPLLAPALLDGLAQLGRELPELASEIHVEARPA
jgi:SAM-dependent methyltransferase